MPTMSVTFLPHFATAPFNFAGEDPLLPAERLSTWHDGGYRTPVRSDCDHFVTAIPDHFAFRRISSIIDYYRRTFPGGSHEVSSILALVGGHSPRLDCACCRHARHVRPRLDIQGQHTDRLARRRRRRLESGGRRARWAHPSRPTAAGCARQISSRMSSSVPTSSVSVSAVLVFCCEPRRRQRDEGRLPLARCRRGRWPMP
jgi:hypothetical protein